MKQVDDELKYPYGCFLRTLIDTGMPILLQPREIAASCEEDVLSGSFVKTDPTFSRGAHHGMAVSAKPP